MESEKNGCLEREEGKSCAELLEKLKEQLCSSNASVRRQAAFTLSWMQEDGLEILKAIIFGDHPESTKNAAAYGLRKMRGRMKKLALDVFKEGLNNRDSLIKNVCSHALEMMGEADVKPAKKKKKAPVKHRIQDVPPKRKPRGRIALQRPNPNRR
ncbi:MAG: HEAT repeat domain-containing protein [Sedimentisphaerales bacterium]|nr:HEAT repeat domain-containing protein [Sedimentisphaerales bacterium]